MLRKGSAQGPPWPGWLHEETKPQGQAGKSHPAFGVWVLSEPWLQFQLNRAPSKELDFPPGLKLLLCRGPGTWSSEAAHILEKSHTAGCAPCPVCSPRAGACPCMNASLTSDFLQDREFLPCFLALNYPAPFHPDLITASEHITSGCSDLL